MLLRLQEDRHLDVARPTVFRVLRALEPGIAAYLPGPLRIHRDVVAEALVLQRAGQFDALLQGALEPALRYSRIPAIQLEPPLAAQRDAGSLGTHGLGTKPAGGPGAERESKRKKGSGSQSHVASVRLSLAARKGNLRPQASREWTSSALAASALAFLLLQELALEQQAVLMRGMALAD